MKGYTSESIPVVFHINISAQDKSDCCNPFKFRLNSEEHTHWPDENVTILDDGLPFIVESVEEVECKAFNATTGHFDEETEKNTDTLIKGEFITKIVLQ